MLLECYLRCIKLFHILLLVQVGPTLKVIWYVWDKRGSARRGKKCIGSPVPSRPNQSVTKTLPLILVFRLSEIILEMEVIGKGGLLTKSGQLLRSPTPSFPLLHRRQIAEYPIKVGNLSPSAFLPHNLQNYWTSGQSLLRL